MNMAVSAAALSVSTSLTTEVDPIFAALDAHKRAVAAYNALVHQEDSIEKTIPPERRRTRSAEEIIEKDDPRWISYHQNLDRLADAEIEAECQLASVVPTSLNGVIALLEYSVEIEKGIGFRQSYFDLDDEKQKIGRSWYYFANRNLIESLRELAA